jgi:hypothetical protein
MHRHGKLLSCRFFDETALIADLIGQTDLDYIEAFTLPDTDILMDAGYGPKRYSATSLLRCTS